MGETLWEEMELGIVLILPAHSSPADLPSTPASFFGVFFVSPSRQDLPRSLWIDQKSQSRPRNQRPLQLLPRLFPLPFSLLLLLLGGVSWDEEAPAETLATKRGPVRDVCWGSGIPSGTMNLVQATLIR